MMSASNPTHRELMWLKLAFIHTGNTDIQNDWWFCEMATKNVSIMKMTCFLFCPYRQPTTLRFCCHLSCYHCILSLFCLPFFLLHQCQQSSLLLFYSSGNSCRLLNAMLQADPAQPQIEIESYNCIMSSYAAADHDCGMALIRLHSNCRQSLSGSIWQTHTHIVHETQC